MHKAQLFFRTVGLQSWRLPILGDGHRSIRHRKITKDSHGMGWLIFICLTWLESDPSSMGRPPVSFRCEPICRWSANDVCRRQSAEGPWRILISTWVGVHFWKISVLLNILLRMKSMKSLKCVWRSLLTHNWQLKCRQFYERSFVCFSGLVFEKNNSFINMFM